MFDAIVFWEPVVSPHKTDFIGSVANNKEGVRVIYVADKKLGQDRLSMGWREISGENFDTILAPNFELIKKLTEKNNNYLHVFSGIRHFDVIVKALANVKKNNSAFCIMSEPRVADGVFGFLRILQSRFFEGGLKKKSGFILAIGSNGPKWFKSVGYDESKIFTFAYFINRKSSSIICVGGDKINIGYVGRMVASKGVFDVINSLIGVENVVLNLVGDGPDRADILSLCRRVGVRYNYIGVVANSEIQEVIKSFDVLTLVSKVKDGWGVVVSEALLNGVPVVVTKHVGASVVIEKHPFMGKCVPDGDPVNIYRAIDDMRASGYFEYDSKALRAQQAEEVLGGDAGGAYFWSIVRHIYFNKPLSCRPL